MPKKRRYSDDELRLAVERACGIADALRLLSVVPRGGNYETFVAGFAYSNWIRPISPARGGGRVLAGR
jgi:hypothetical protein